MWKERIVSAANHVVYWLTYDDNEQDCGDDDVFEIAERVRVISSISSSIHGRFRCVGLHTKQH